MTALDIITLLLVGIAGALGFLRGFVSEALSLVAWGVALMAVRLFQSTVSIALTGVVGTEAGAAVLAFALVFGVFFLGGRMLARNMGSVARKSLLGPVDRLLGLGFGALKGLLGAIILFLVLTLAVDTYDGDSSDRPAWIVKSQTYPLLNASASALVTAVKARQKPREAGHGRRDEL
jgi:membrane protein required for colicin V production